MQCMHMLHASAHTCYISRPYLSMGMVLPLLLTNLLLIKYYTLRGGRHPGYIEPLCIGWVWGLVAMAAACPRWSAVVHHILSLVCQI